MPAGDREPLETAANGFRNLRKMDLARTGFSQLCRPMNESEEDQIVYKVVIVREHRAQQFLGDLGKDCRRRKSARRALWNG
jgi:hypothetical protein